VLDPARPASPSWAAPPAGRASRGAGDARTKSPQPAPLEPREISREAQATEVRDDREAERFGGTTLFLLEPERLSGQLLAAAGGIDLLAPRPLTLWRVDPESGRAAPVAHGTSRSDGLFLFDRLLLPEDGAQLVATERGREPGQAGASRPALLPPPRDLAPPPVLVERLGAHRWRLHAYAAGGAKLLISEADAIEPQRFEVPRDSSAWRRSLQVDVSAPRRSQWLVVAQVLPDGRRSGWVPVAPAVPVPEAREDEAADSGRD
jgi:hypothetical protein